MWKRKFKTTYALSVSQVIRSSLKNTSIGQGTVSICTSVELYSRLWPFFQFFRSKWLFLRALSFSVSLSYLFSQQFNSTTIVRSVGTITKLIPSLPPPLLNVEPAPEHIAQTILSRHNGFNIERGRGLLKCLYAPLRKFKRRVSAFFIFLA